MKKDCDKKEKIKKITLHRQVEGVHISSIVNEGIRAFLNLFFFTRRFHTIKSTKRIQANKNKRSSIFMLIKNI